MGARCTKYCNVYISDSRRGASQQQKRKLDAAVQTRGCVRVTDLRDSLSAYLLSVHKLKHIFEALYGADVRGLHDACTCKDLNLSLQKTVSPVRADSCVSTKVSNHAAECVGQHDNTFDLILKDDFKWGEEDSQQLP